MAGAASPCHTLVSIVLPCWNQLGYTRLCVQSLLRYTRPPWELIAVDNGSGDGTGTYLLGLQDAFPVPVVVISNAENRGFAVACNQGARAARGQYIMSVNTDVVATCEYADHLVGLLESQPALGMAGPAQGTAALQPSPAAISTSGGRRPSKASLRPRKCS